MIGLKPTWSSVVCIRLWAHFPCLKKQQKWQYFRISHLIISIHSLGRHLVVSQIKVLVGDIKQTHQIPITCFNILFWFNKIVIDHSIRPLSCNCVISKDKSILKQVCYFDTKMSGTTNFTWQCLNCIFWFICLLTSWNLCFLNIEIHLRMTTWLLLLKAFIYVFWEGYCKSLPNFFHVGACFGDCLKEERQNQVQVLPSNLFA